MPVDTRRAKLIPRRRICKITRSTVSERKGKDSALCEPWDEECEKCGIQMESGRPGRNKPGRPRIGGIPGESAFAGRRVFYSQVVGYGAKAQSGRGGAQAGDLLLQVVVHDAFQRDVAVVHDDVNRRQRLEA